MKYAITMLCMIKDHYVVGACINAFVNKSIMFYNNIQNIDLIIMCDDYIFNKYENLLLKYFDKVVKINLLKYESKSNQQITKSWNKKYNWISYSINKWQCLNFIEYDKILFLDIDILPMVSKFYNIFNINTPGLHIISDFIKMNKCINNDKVYDILNDVDSYNEYITRSNNKIKHYSLDGGFVLLTPSIEEYKNYLKFIENINDNGIYASKISGIDETSLFYYLTKYTKKIIYKICNKYAIIPWSESNRIFDKNTKAYAYNFLSYIKPWKKTKFLAWKEEQIWRDIYKKMTKTNDLKKLYKRTLKDGINEYIKYDNNQQKHYYNTEYSKNTNLFNIYKNMNYKNILELESKFNLKKKNKNYGLLSNTKKLFYMIKKYINKK
jgi:hypothetical protein